MLVDVRGVADLTEAARRLISGSASDELLRVNGGRVWRVSAWSWAGAGRRAGCCCAGPTPPCTPRRPRVRVGSRSSMTPRPNRSRDWLDVSSNSATRSSGVELSLLYQPIVDLKTDTLPLVRGAGAVDPSAARTGTARHVHPHGRGDRRDRADRFLGAPAASPRLLEWQQLFPQAGLTMGVNISAVQLEPSRQDLLSVIVQSGRGSPRHLARGHRTDGHRRRRQRPGEPPAPGRCPLRTRRLRHVVLEPDLPAAVPGRGHQDRPHLRVTDDRRRDPTRHRARHPRPGESLSVNVIAEGIETVEQRDALLDLGCRYGQGYLLAAPITPEECVRGLRTRS